MDLPMSSPRVFVYSCIREFEHSRSRLYDYTTSLPLSDLPVMKILCNFDAQKPVIPLS